MASLVLELNLPEDKPKVFKIFLAPQEKIHESLQDVVIRYGDDIKRFTFEERKDYSFEFKSKAGNKILTLDFGGTLPSGVLTFPDETSAIIEPLPLLVNVKTGFADENPQIWNPKTPPKNLERLTPFLFKNNRQIKRLTQTFANLPHLKKIPKDIFNPLGQCETFIETFKNSALEELPEELFTFVSKAQDFTGTFKDCYALHEVPTLLFSHSQNAYKFVQTFMNSALKKIPSMLFMNVRTRGQFIETFSHTQITEVPTQLLKALDPETVDGMFEPKNKVKNDPLALKTAPKIPADFLLDTLKADGIPTIKL